MFDIYRHEPMTLISSARITGCEKNGNVEILHAQILRKYNFRHLASTAAEAHPRVPWVSATLPPEANVSELRGAGRGDAKPFKI